jgi:hypothetical protein
MYIPEAVYNGLLIYMRQLIGRIFSGLHFLGINKKYERNINKKGNL